MAKSNKLTFMLQRTICN